jgi:hypothetical protein
MWLRAKERRTCVGYRLAPVCERYRKYLCKWIPSPQESNSETSDMHQDVILVQKIRPAPRVYVCNLESEIRSTEDQGDVYISLRWMLGSGL